MLYLNMRSTQHLRFIGSLVGVTLCFTSLHARSSEPSNDRGTAKVSVECKRTSGLVELNIHHFRKIGKVRIVVKDGSGSTVYVEEGKAMTTELVRKLDKGMFPKGNATMIVEARDLSVAQPFVIQ